MNLQHAKSPSTESLCIEFSNTVIEATDEKYDYNNNWKRTTYFLLQVCKTDGFTYIVTIEVRRGGYVNNSVTAKPHPGRIGPTRTPANVLVLLITGNCLILQ